MRRMILFGRAPSACMRSLDHPLPDGSKKNTKAPKTPILWLNSYSVHAPAARHRGGISRHGGLCLVVSRGRSRRADSPGRGGDPEDRRRRGSPLDREASLAGKHPHKARTNSRSEEETYHVYDDRGEDGAGDGLAVRRIVNAAGELFVVAAIQAADDAEDDDGEDGDDRAKGSKYVSSSLSVFLLGAGTPRHRLEGPLRCPPGRERERAGVVSVLRTRSKPAWHRREAS